MAKRLKIIQLFKFESDGNVDRTNIMKKLQEMFIDFDFLE